MIPRIVLAYSGSLASSAAIPWLSEHYGVEVITLTLDLGQHHAVETLRDRALACGAASAHVLDVREVLARECLLPALHARTPHDGGAAVQPPLAYPLIAAKLIDVAASVEAQAVAHASRGIDVKQTGAKDGRAHHGGLDACLLALNPAIRVIAPASLWEMDDAQLREYARSRGIPVADEGRYSVYENVSGRAISSRADNAALLGEDVYRLTAPAARVPSVPAHIEIAFQQGVPVAINGVPMMLTELMESVATIAGNHGIGRLAGPEPHTVYEAPAGVVLNAALDALGTDAHPASGVVRMTLFRGQHVVVDREAAAAPDAPLSGAQTCLAADPRS